jgi:hypothetical protein
MPCCHHYTSHAPVSTPFPSTAACHSSFALYITYISNICCACCSYCICVLIVIVVLTPWSRGLRCGSAAARLLGLRVRIPRGAGTHTGCPRRNVPDFGRVFLVLKYTDITQNTYVQSWTVTEIMVREKWGLPWDSTHCTCQLTVLSVSSPWVWCHITPTQLTLASKLHMYFLQGDVSAGHSCAMYSAWSPKDNYDVNASVYVVQFNGFMSLIS